MEKTIDHVRYQHEPAGSLGGDIPLWRVDEERENQGRRVLKADRNPLYKSRSPRFRWSQRTKERARAMLIALFLTLGSVIPYIIMIAMWFKSYRISPRETWIVFAVFIVIALALCFLSNKTQKDWAWLQWFGLMFAQATIIGLIVGISAYYRSMRYYWMHDELRTYTNVCGAQHSDEFIDASVFLFTTDTRIDTTRSAGLQSRWNGNTYCVAPIVDSSMGTGDTIYYWAVGMNCCNRRANFQCDDARDVKTRSGLVVLEQADMPEFEAAVSLEKSWYFTNPAEKPKFVRWSNDPLNLKEDYYTNARDRTIAVSVVYWFIIFILSYNIAWLNPKPEEKKIPSGGFREAGA